MKKKLLLNFLLILIIIATLKFSSADINNQSQAYVKVEDTYVFNTDGSFIRTSITSLAHNSQESLHLIFRQTFPNPSQEKQTINGNITYTFNLGDFNDIPIIKSPQDDFQKGVIIKEVDLPYGQIATMERTYSGFTNQTNINLNLNFNPTSYVNCSIIECENYNYTFKRIIKIPKDMNWGLSELNMINLGSLPDNVYDDGIYKIYVWDSYTIDTGDFKYQNINFSYNYINSGLAWNIIITILGAFLGAILGVILGGWFKKENSLINEESIIRKNSTGMMEKFDNLKYWLDVNIYIQVALAFAGLDFAILSSILTLPWLWGKILGVIVSILILILAGFQLILGIRQMGRDAKAKKQYKIRYQKYLRLIRLRRKIAKQTKRKK